VTARTVADRTSAHPDVERFARHVNPAFVKLLGVFGYGRLFTRAQGVWVEDHRGRRYLDLLAGFGAANIGHNHPRLVQRLRDFLAEGAVNLVHVGPSAPAGLLAEKLVALAGPPFDVALLSSGGGEAVEAGMKLARAATRRPGFVFCDGGFHGTSLGTLSIMGEERMRAPFEPLLAGCARVPFGDLGALERALKPRAAAAFVVEPIQGEAGVVMPPPGFLASAQELCRRYGTLLVLDEVQTGIGRTGTWFAFQQERGLTPDVVALAKSLGGSVAPIGATLVSREVHERAYGTMGRFDLHGSTFGGNSFACVAAIETLAIIEDEGLLASAAARGAQLLDGLRGRLAGHPLVRDVRGRGLLVGVELGPTGSGLVNRIAPGLVRKIARAVFGQWAALGLLERDVICQPAAHHWNVLKIEPPLTIAAGEVERAVDAIAAVLGEYTGIAPLLADVTRRVGRQWVGGFDF